MRSITEFVRFDPETGKWESLAKLPEPGDGEWKIAVRLEDDRFFHRMLPYDGRLLLVGGASMRSGKRLPFEVVELPSLK